jgi:hypothetical protein
MILGKSTSTFTLVHFILSLIGIFSGATGDFPYEIIGHRAIQNKMPDSEEPGSFAF